MTSNFQQRLAAIPFEDLWESERLWPDPFDAPDVPPRPILASYLNDRQELDADLARHIENSIACLRALDESASDDSAERGDSPAREGFFQIAGVEPDGGHDQGVDQRKLLTGAFVPPPSSTEIKHGLIYSVRSEFSLWDGTSLQKGFNFNPVDVLLISDRIERPAGEFLRAIPCSSSEIWRTEDMLCPEDLVFHTRNGSEWVLHTWLGYPVSTEDLGECLGKLSETEISRIKVAMARLREDVLAEKDAKETEPEWLGLERERLAERADSLPNTVDAQRWKLEARDKSEPISGPFQPFLTVVEEESVVFFPPSPSREEEALLAAREDLPDRPLLTGSFKLKKRPDIRVDFSETEEPEGLCLEVRNDPEGYLEDTRVSDVAGNELAIIADGLAVFKRPPDGRCSLAHSSGEPIALETILDEP